MKKSVGIFIKQKICQEKFSVDRIEIWTFHNQTVVSVSQTERVRINTISLLCKVMSQFTIRIPGITGDQWLL